MSILQNIRLIRRQDEVLHEKQFAWSLGFVSLLAGIVVGVVLIGARLVMFAFLGIVIIFVLRVAGSTFVSTLENAGKGISVPSFDIKLMDGTELYEDWGGRYRDNYGHHYEEVDGKYVQMD